ncbi:MAG TPA: ribonuclease HII [Candidatus Paceibacterota bacterium]
MKSWIIGVDEAGRAPLAGPVSVGLVMVPEHFDVLKEFPGVKDSKQLSELKREALYESLLKRKQAGDVSFCVRFSDHLYIDEYGITRAVKHAIISGMRRLSASEEGVTIMLDGLLSAPSKYTQQTIINGDDLVPIISLASVAAKVERDRLMKKFAKKYPEYSFEEHKGYATKKHREAISKFGLSDIHRRTFCKGILMSLIAAKNL